MNRTLLQPASASDLAVDVLGTSCKRPKPWRSLRKDATRFVLAIASLGSGLLAIGLCVVTDSAYGQQLQPLPAANANSKLPTQAAEHPPAATGDDNGKGDNGKDDNGKGDQGKGVSTDPLAKDNDQALERLKSATRKLAQNQMFDFEYRFEEGSTILWQVEHAATTETRDHTGEETSASRSLSVMQWQVVDVDSLGNATVVLTLKSAKMWQQTDQNDPIEYDSQQLRGDVPEEYRSFAERIGIPIATYKLNPQGETIDIKETYRSVKFGVGSITMPLPGRSVRCGQAWHEPGSIEVRTTEGARRRIRTRIEYRLQRVEDGIAWVSFDTQVITPVDDARIQSQLLQQLSKGTIEFDMNAGQMVAKHLGWSEKCLGFKGPESSLKYLAKYDFRRLIESDNAASGKMLQAGRDSNKEHLQPLIRLADENPIFRW